MENGHLSLVGLNKEGGMETWWRKASQSLTGVEPLLHRWELICSHSPLLYADVDLEGFICSAPLVPNLPFQLWLAPRFLHLLYIIQDPEVQTIICFYLNLFAHCYLYPDLLHVCVEDIICS